MRAREGSLGFFDIATPPGLHRLQRDGGLDRDLELREHRRELRQVHHRGAEARPDRDAVARERGPT